jgi:hypothetical protein
LYFRSHAATAADRAAKTEIAHIWPQMNRACRSNAHLLVSPHLTTPTGIEGRLSSGRTIRYVFCMYRIAAFVEAPVFYCTMQVPPLALPWRKSGAIEETEDVMRHAVILLSILLSGSQAHAEEIVLYGAGSLKGVLTAPTDHYTAKTCERHLDHQVLCGKR